MYIHKEPKVRLLARTANPMEVCGQAANLCYNKVDGAVLEAMTVDRDGGLLRKTERVLLHCLDAGHHSIFEHPSMTVLVEGVSRSFTHQLVRHRLASYSQQSQHWCVETPTACELLGVSDEPLVKKVQRERYYAALEASKEAYDELVTLGVPTHEARQVLPNGWETKIVATMNMRSWMHFIKLRACKRNCPEITRVALCVRGLFTDWLGGCREGFVAEFMNHVGPPCLLTGRCPEGKASCGAPWVRA